MIRYALSCDKGHGFDSWFSGSAGFEAQRDGGLIACPHCGATKIDRQIMAPAVRLGESNEGKAGDGEERAGEAVPVVMADKDREMRDMLRAFRRHVEANSEDVGPRFAEEARKIHFGEVDHRSIRGEASPSEVKALHEEGVAVSPLPALPDEMN